MPHRKTIAYPPRKRYHLSCPSPYTPPTTRRRTKPPSSSVVPPPPSSTGPPPPPSFAPTSPHVFLTPPSFNPKTSVPSSKTFSILKSTSASASYAPPQPPCTTPSPSTHPSRRRHSTYATPLRLDHPPNMLLGHIFHFFWLFISSLPPLSNLIQFQGWGALLNRYLLIYPDAVREFYYNAIFSVPSNILRTHIYDVPIKLTTVTLGQILQIPNIGFDTYSKGEWPFIPSLFLDTISSFFFPPLPLLALLKSPPLLSLSSSSSLPSLHL